MKLLRFAAAEFGPLIVFLALSTVFGVKIAIAGAVAATLLDAGWRWRRGVPFTRLYLLVTALTLGFGAVDLWAATPFLLVYEAPITNALIGAAFVVGAFGAKPLLMEVAAARQGQSFADTGAIRRFFRLLTLVWAVYFILKAAAYVWLAATMPMSEAIALRSLLGGISLGLMSALSFTQGRRMFFLCQRFGWLGPAAR